MDWDHRDLDAGLKRIGEVMDRIKRTNDYQVKIIKSKSNHFWNLEIIMKETLKKMEIVALQAIMGSDHRREAMNFLRARSTQYTLKQFKQEGNIFRRSKE